MAFGRRERSTPFGRRRRRALGREWLGAESKTVSGRSGIGQLEQVTLCKQNAFASKVILCEQQIIAAIFPVFHFLIAENCRVLLRVRSAPLRGRSVNGALEVRNKHKMYLYIG